MPAKPNQSDPGARPKAPASYFPSSEKTYGRPIDYWLELVRTRAANKHMDVVIWLKSAHGLGHGHANAVVACVRS